MAGKSLLISLIVGLFSVVVLFLQYQRFEVEVTGGERVPVVVAVKPIERDKVITDDMISVREVPHVYVEDRAVRDRDRAKIVGLRIATSVGAQQTLMWTDLVTSSEEQRNLSSLVQPGSRAVAVRTARQDSSTALIRPGDYVDVLATVTPKLGISSGDDLKSIVLLQKVLVLAVGSITSPDLIEEKASDKTRTGTGDESLLTMSVTLPEAQLVALAADTGRVSVILRNIEDTNVIDRPQDVTVPRTSGGGGGEREAGAPRPSRPHGPTALPR